MMTVQQSSSTASQSVTILWFRRDLRLADNRALQAAIDQGGKVVCVYLREPGDPYAGALGAAQAWWLHHSLKALNASLQTRGNRLILRTGKPGQVLRELAEATGARQIAWNRRHDPVGVATDTELKAALIAEGFTVKSFAGDLMHEPTKLFNQSGQPFRVFTPFFKALEAAGEPHLPFEAPIAIPAHDTDLVSESLSDWNLLPEKPDWATEFGETFAPGEDGARAALDLFVSGAIKGYRTRRDIPGEMTTSKLSPHLALGEIAPARLWHAVTDAPGAGIEDIVHFRKEIGWRDFSWNLLFHNPDLRSVNLNRRFDAFPWRASDELLTFWQRGHTGYPIVDAGMRQLWRTGWMHNRVRMIVASFLIKDLMIDWREGEAWFRDTLVDADPASNVASWQWVAGSGADAAPFFRIFNPITQGEKFDPAGRYIRAFVPELAALPDEFIHRPFEAPLTILSRAGVTLGKTYPKPLVDHASARNRALAAFQSLSGT